MVDGVTAIIVENGGGSVGSQDQQQAQELKIFSRFAEACGLRIRPESIEKRAPPEPDILCEIEGKGPVAFEMVELVDQELMRQNLGGGQDLKRWLDDACQERSEMRKSLGDARINVDPRPTATKPVLQNSVDKILDLLLQLPSTFEGDVLSDLQLRSENLRELILQVSKAVIEVNVRRGGSGGPSFSVCPAVKINDQALLDILHNKFGKYKSTNDNDQGTAIELLAYFLSIPPPSRDWRSQVDNCVKKNLRSSRFRRVWIYDCWNKAVEYRYPEF